MTAAAQTPIHIVGGSKDVGNEKLRQRLKRFMDENPHLSLTVLGRKNQIGVSPAGIHAYLSGKYFLDKEMGGSGVNPENSNLEQKVRDYLDRVDGEPADGFNIPFADTTLWKQFQYACNTAVEENIIVLAYGSPGYGKTESLTQYMVKKQVTRPIHILCSVNMTTGFFVRKIAAELGISKHMPIPDLEEKIANTLFKNKRAIFIDQANFLNKNCLGTVCHLWEIARVPVVLVGTHNLYKMFTELTDREDIRGQITSRVALMVPLMGLDKEEVAAVVTKALGAYATSSVIAQVVNTTGGNFRNLHFLLRRLSKLIVKRKDGLDNGTWEIGDLVSEAASRLMMAA